MWPMEQNWLVWIIAYHSMSAIYICGISLMRSFCLCCSLFFRVSSSLLWLFYYSFCIQWIYLSIFSMVFIAGTGSIISCPQEPRIIWVKSADTAKREWRVFLWYAVPLCQSYEMCLMEQNSLMWIVANCNMTTEPKNLKWHVQNSYRPLFHCTICQGMMRK